MNEQKKNNTRTIELRSRWSSQELSDRAKTRFSLDILRMKWEQKRSRCRSSRWWNLPVWPSACLSSDCSWTRKNLRQHCCPFNPIFVRCQSETMLSNNWFCFLVTLQRKTSNKTCFVLSAKERISRCFSLSLLFSIKEIQVIRSIEYASERE